MLFVFSSISREHLNRPLDVCQARILPIRLKLQDKQISLFHRTTGGMFQSYVPVLCSLWWLLTKNCLSICYSLMGPMNARTLGYQIKQVISGYPLGGNHKNKSTRHMHKLPSGKSPFWSEAEKNCKYINHWPSS